MSEDTAEHILDPSTRQLCS